MIRAIIIDDEYLARQRVMKLLEAYAEIKIMGEARNGGEAVELIKLKSPDLIFLDVQMPDMNGFEVVNKIDCNPPPYIVFTTAFDSYAIEAFNIHALDYLLKPIDEDRFRDSMAQVTQHFESQKTTELNKQLIKVIQSYNRTDQFVNQLTIADRGREYKVDLDEVLFLEANGNYVNLKTISKSFLYRSTMNALSTKVSPEEFMRIHRSLIVNKRYIQQCTYQNNNEYQFLMKDGSKLISGRSFKSEIMEYLSKS